LLFVTVVSVIVAITTSAVAWHLAAEARRRSSLRVAALSAEIHDADLDLGPSPLDEFRSETSSREADLFATPPAAASGSRFATAIACGVIVVGGLAPVGLLMTSGSHRAAPAPAANQATPAGLPNPAPLELVALAHERAGDDLTVRGIVRNPPSG